MADADEVEMKNANTLHNIANILTETGNFKKAIKYYAKALDITKMILGDNHILVGDTFNNIGLAYDKMNEYNHAVNSQE